MSNLLETSLFIDPGKKAGYALFFDLKLFESGCCNGTLDDVHEARKLIEGVRPQHNFPNIFVETQFIHPKQKTTGIITLVERAGMWHTLGKLLGKDTYRIDPAVWLDYWCLVPDLTIEDKKERNLDFQLRTAETAEKAVNKKGIQQNEAQAILMGLYCLEMGKRYW